jgi:type I restriction enzyme S subunit
LSGTAARWPRIRLRFVSRINPPCPEFAQLADTDDVTFLPLEAVWPPNPDTSAVRQKSDVVSGFTRFRDGDVLLPKITPTFQAGRATVARRLLRGIGAGTTELHVLRPEASLDATYLQYFLNSDRFLSDGRAAMQGVAGQQRVPDEFVRNAVISLPPVKEQLRLVRFLDDATGRLDGLIRTKERLRTLLRERKTAVTQQWLTGAKSGATRWAGTPLPTIPRVPHDWKVVRNKFAIRELADLSESGEEELLTVSHLTGVTPRSGKDVNMFLAESLVGYKKCEPGDLVINTMWAWMGALGVARVAGVVSPSYGVYRLDQSQMEPDFYDLFYRTPAYVTEMTRHSRGIRSSRLRLYPDVFLSLCTIIPPLSEQRRILDRLRSELARLELLDQRLATSVALLRERRRVLISAVTEGRVGPNAVGSDQEPPDLYEAVA